MKHFRCHRPEIGSHEQSCRLACVRERCRCYRLYSLPCWPGRKTRSAPRGAAPSCAAAPAPLLLRPWLALKRAAAACSIGGGAYSCIACLSHMTIDHASLSRRSTVSTPNRDTSNNWGVVYPIGEMYSILCRGWGVTHCHALSQSYDPRPSHPYNAGTERVGFSSTRQTLLAPSANSREVFGESHGGWAAS